MARTDTLANYLTDVIGAYKELTGETGTVKASELDTKIANLPSGGGDISEYFDEYNFRTGSSSSIGHWIDSIKKIPPPEGSPKNLHNFFGGFEGENIDLSKLDTTNVISFTSTFINCSKLKEIDLSNLNLDNVTNMSGLLRGCQNLTSINFGNFNANGVTNLERTFYNCYSLTSLDLSKFTTSNLTNLYYTFYGCRSLRHLDIRNFDFTTVSEHTDTFGSGSSSVPTDCEIIVKDDTAKTWITTNFPTLTNVKTVAELNV